VNDQSKGHSFISTTATRGDPTTRLPHTWQVRSARLKVETFSSLIWEVQLADGTPAIVKDLKAFDDVGDELRGAHYLSWRAGSGAVRLLDIVGHRMLLEHCGDSMLSHYLAERGDGPATEIIAEVLREILSPTATPVPVELQPLEERFSALFEKGRADRTDGIASMYVDGAYLAERLLAEPDHPKPLHGDLHHENIMLAQRGWLVIDPKGVYGDPAFEAANVFYNPLDRDDLCLDPARIERLSAVFSRVLRQDPRRLLDYAIAYGCLSAAWHAGDANRSDEARELAVAVAIQETRRHL
jgi:streptomycin 6-kinase